MVLLARDRRSRGIEWLLNGSVRQAVGEEQNPASTADVTSRERSGLSDLIGFRSFIGVQFCRKQPRSAVQVGDESPCVHAAMPNSS